MNTAVKIISHQRVIGHESVINKEENLVLPFPELKILFLLLIVLFSALTLIYIKDLNRQLFVGLQNDSLVITITNS